MRRITFQKVALIWLLCQALSASAGPVTGTVPISPTAIEKSLVVVGETHQKPRSHALVREMIGRALNTGRCVDFALEITVSAESGWRAAEGRKAAIAELQLSSIHQSESLRELMRQTSAWARDACLTLHAIDRPTTGTNGGRDRDLYMAERLGEIVTSERLVIALVGNLHAVRTLDWDDTVSHPKPSMTKRLEDDGFRPFVALQDWVEIPDQRVYRGDAQAARNAVDHLLRVASVYPANAFSRYADLLIQWPKVSVEQGDTDSP